MTSKEPQSAVQTAIKVYFASGGDYSDYRVYAVFTTREAAEQFIKIDTFADTVEEWEALDKVPSRERWFCIQQMRGQSKPTRTSNLRWPWEGAGFVGQKRKAWNYSRWDHGERAFGTDEGAVEKVWKEQHAAAEAEAAGL